VGNLSEQKKWVGKLSSQCGLSAAFLKDVLEELSESCYGDAGTSRDVIEELTSSCHLNEEELRKFVKDVSKSCPIDAKKLQAEVAKAKGKKNLAFQAIDNAGPRSVSDRGGVR